MHKILVLGSEGYLGSVLIPLLNKSKFKITGVDRCFFGKHNKSSKNIKIIKKDYSKLEKKFFKKFDYIVDLINISNDPASELNKKFTKRVNYENKIKLYNKIKNLKNIKRYIYLSSCSVYGNNKDVIDELTPAKPISLYSKLCLEYEKFLRKNRKLNFTILRLGTLYGWSPRMRYDIAINKILRDMIFNKKIEILGGEQLRFFCYNQFACNVIKKLISESKKNTINKIFNIGNFNTNIIDLTKKIFKITNFKNVNVYHEKNNIDKRSYKVSTKSAKKFIEKDYQLSNLTNHSILETFIKIKKDKKPYLKNKITLTIYKEFLEKNKI
jgi:nucleoside-diphosphate-sugar epimerase